MKRGYLLTFTGALIFVSLAAALAARIAFAQILVPTAVTIYFEKDSKPYEKNVRYTVSCYGNYLEFNEKGLKKKGSELEKIYSYSAKCPSYGCKIYMNYPIGYMAIDHCDLDAKTEGKTFQIKNFGNEPALNCTDEKNSENNTEKSCVMHFNIPTEIDEKDIFPDVNPPHRNYEAISYVKSKNIINGYEDGAFKPDKIINRAEFLKIIAGSFLKNQNIESCAYNYFNDVPPDEWYSKYICAAKKENIINGYNDGTFKPTNPISIAEAAKIIVETLKLPVEKSASDSWYSPYLGVLSDRSAIPETIGSPSQNITRGETAEIIYRISAESF